MTRQAVRLARTFAREVEFSAEDATRSDVDYLCEVFAAARYGRAYDTQRAGYRRIHSPR